MKIQIPDTLKKELPTNLWGKVLNSTPVVMTVLATMLAGLSSSEMTRAQYDRSVATQQQSKAGDQWGFYQAKRLRGSSQASTLDLLSSLTEIKPLDATNVATVIGSAAEAPGVKEALGHLASGTLPAIPSPAAPDPKIVAAIEFIEHSPTNSELAQELNDITDRSIADEIRATQARSAALDNVIAPIAQASDRLAAALEARRGDQAALNRDFTAARIRFAVRRYEQEAKINQFIANLYELQVRKSNLSADRHIRRSQRFFYGMLAAQTGVIAATFAIAARQRSLLWAFAAAAGVGALTFAAYVFMFL
ncbi:MAG TPA: DUF4337 family protein [Candidatus Didemnitutus sp.]|nr:DUF4337 family protein [Candidatus Didemnitutus sp.]